MVRRVIRLIGLSVEALLRHDMTSNLYPRERGDPQSNGCDMSRNARNQMYTDFDKRHQVSPCFSAQHHWRPEMHTMNIITCPLNSTEQAKKL